MSELQRLKDIVAHLRGPDGCPWDKEQTAQSMRPYLLEETYEVLEAIGSGDDRALQEELGDLLFNILLIAQTAQDRGAFGIEDVARGIADKMVVRHPHVFGAEERARSGSIARWEARKAEARTGGRLSGVPRALPALLRAHRMGEKAAAVGFDFEDAAGPLAKVHEELGELEEALQGDDRAHIEHEFGDLLTAAANLGRKLSMPPEDALQLANDRFALRFSVMEEIATERGQRLEALDMTALDGLWNEAKRRLGQG